MESILKEQPDVVVMDMILPGLDGIGILEEINKSDQLMKRPVIIIETALRMSGLIEEALQNGADYYLMKPISNRVLIQRIFQLTGDEIQNIQPVTREIPTRDNGVVRCYDMKKDKGGCSGDLEMDVTRILLEMGIPAHIKGYQYIREGIIMAFYDRNMLHYITKFLYPTKAQKYKTTSSSVERTIRHAIEVAWRRGNMETLEDVFGYSVCAGKGKPTNSEFMALLTDKLRLQYRTRNAS